MWLLSEDQRCMSANRKEITIMKLSLALSFVLASAASCCVGASVLPVNLSSSLALSNIACFARVKCNPNFAKLASGYLFPKIGCQ